jgi:signal peptidase
VKVGIPYAGFVLAALSQRELRMLVVGLPALLIALMSLAGLWREAGTDAAAVPR